MKSGRREIRLWSVFWLLLTALAPLIFFAIVSNNILRGVLHNDAEARLRLTAGLRQSELEGWTDALTTRLYRLLVALPTLPDAIRSGDLRSPVLKLQETFSQAVGPADFTEIMLISASGRLLFSTNSERYGPPERLCPVRIVCASEFFTENGQTWLMAQYPILDSNREQLGVLLGLAETRQLDAILGNRAGLGATGSAYLLGRDGRIRWQPGSGAETGGAVVLPNFEQSIQLSETAIYSGLAGQDVLGLNTTIPRLLSSLVVEQELSEIDQPLTVLPRFILGLSALIIAATILGSRILAVRAERPVLQMSADLRDLRLQYARFRENEQRRSKTIADMGHEFRTPINSILNFSGFLTDGLFGTLNNDQSEMVRQIHSNSQHLLELINDLIDISQYEAGQMRLFVNEYDLAPVFDQAIGTLQSLILEKPITIQTDFPRTWPPLRGDRRRVLQILLNLISNAGKFTEKGSITLRAHTFASKIEIRVEDSGPGVDAAVVEHLFEPFNGLYNARGYEKGGTGLGLPLSRIFARMHGGDLIYEPGDPGGAVFILTLPLNAIENEQPIKGN